MDDWLLSWTPFLVIRWTLTIVQAVWRTCHLQRPSLKRIGENDMYTLKLFAQHPAVHCLHFNVYFINDLSFIMDYLCSAVGVQTVLTARVACTHCLPEPPTSQLLYLMTPPRRPWRRPTTWPVASVAGPPGTLGWLTNQLVSAIIIYWHYILTLNVFLSSQQPKVLMYI